MRSVEEWIGKDDDAPIPPRVRSRTFEAKKGRCHKCGRKIKAADKWTCEHVIAIENGGANRESNLDLTCSWCLPDKNAADAAIKKRLTKIMYRDRGIRSTSRPMPGSRDSQWKKKMDGTTVRR